MKKIITIAALATVAVAAQAAEGSKVLSMTEFDVGGVKVILPKTQEADESICVAYVSSASRQADDVLEVKVAKVCDRPVQVAASGLFPAVLYPAKLLSMRVVHSTDGLATQVPELAR